MSRFRRRGRLGTAPAFLAIAALAACANDSDRAPQSASASAGGIASSAPTHDSPPAPVAVLTRAEAAEKYRSLADAYRKGRTRLDRALDQEPLDMAAIKRGGAEAATAYRARIAGLLETAWPADVKPLIDDYLTKAAEGLNF